LKSREAAKKIKTI